MYENAKSRTCRCYKAITSIGCHAVDKIVWTTNCLTERDIYKHHSINSFFFGRIGKLDLTTELLYCKNTRAKKQYSNRVVVVQ